jgi:hypothetical protein
LIPRLRGVDQPVALLGDGNAVEQFGPGEDGVVETCCVVPDVFVFGFADEVGELLAPIS